VKHPKYAAVCHPVRDVNLRGSADLAYWREHLEPLHLAPADVNGKAQIIIIAASMKYMGIEFSEASFAVVLHERDSPLGPDAVFLTRAYNSSRMFTFCERTFFSTPYRHADCRLSIADPTYVEIRDSTQVLFRAEMNRRKPQQNDAPSYEDAWHGTIFIPADAGKKLYFARLEGLIRAYPFDPATDSFIIEPTNPHDATLKSLLDSNFAPTEWLIRDSATHSRTKTYNRKKFAN
jgi:hypothetical protein